MATKDTKSKIIKAAYYLIAERGYEKASMEQIANSIDMKKASMYYHFKSKEEIALTLIDTYYEYQISDFSFYELSTKKEITDYLINFGIKIIEETKNDTDFKKVFSEIRLLGERNADVKEKLSSFELETKNLFEKLFKHGINIKVLDEDFDITTKSNMLYLLLEGIDNSILYGKNIDVSNTYISLVNLIMN